MRVQRASALENRQAPAALAALLADVLLADAPPENIVVREALPPPADLRGAAEGDGVEIAEDLEGDLARQGGEGVDADEEGELLGEEGELGEAAHGEDAAEDELAAGVGRGGEI